MGTSKIPFLETEVGGCNLAVQPSIKAALDPQGILSPGKWL